MNLNSIQDLVTFPDAIHAQGSSTKCKTLFNLHEVSINSIAQLRKVFCKCDHEGLKFSYNLCKLSIEMYN